MTGRPGCSIIPLGFPGFDGAESTSVMVYVPAIEVGQWEKEDIPRIYTSSFETRHEVVVGGVLHWYSVHQFLHSHPYQEMVRWTRKVADNTGCCKQRSVYTRQNYGLPGTSIVTGLDKDR